jgi:catechol-2,3-dioxygenase
MAHAYGACRRGRPSPICPLPLTSASASLMSPKQQAACQYGVVLRTRDMGKLKAFYRDVLMLGPPLIDSNFWVEFAIPGSGILALEPLPGAEAADKGTTILTTTATVSWLLIVEDFNESVKALAERGVKIIRPPREVPGRRTASFADPEGNVFTVYTVERQP